MKIKHILSIVLFFSISLSGFAQNKKSTSLNFRFATRAEAQMLITDIDNFSNGLNQFDIDLRLQKKNGRKSEWLRLAMNEAKNWGDVEKEKVTDAFKVVSTNIKKMKLHFSFPDDIVLLKTSMKEELNMAAYTRKSWIAIGEGFLQTATNEQIQYLVAHELFHILTRNSVEFKRTAYATIGFNVLDHEIILPTDVVAKRISNPDIERRDSYVKLNINGTETKCVQITYTTQPYSTGTIFDYLNVGFIPLNEDLIPVMKDGQTVIYPVSMVADEFKQKVGSNTDYTVDPEEVLADNFSYMLIQKKGLPSPEITNKLKEAFTVKK